MRKTSDSDRFVQRVLIISLVAIVIFLIGSTIAMVISAKYEFFNEFFSELGVRTEFKVNKGYTIHKAPFPEIFNITIMVTGVLLTPFFIAINKKLNPQRKKEKILLRLTVFTGVSSGITLVTVGIFDFGTFYFAHLVVAGSFYFSVMLTGLFWSLGLLVIDKNSVYKKSKLWIIDIFISAFIIAVGLFVGVFANIYPEIIEFIAIAFYQKVFVYAAFFLLGMVAVRISLIIRKESNLKADLERNSLNF